MRLLTRHYVALYQVHVVVHQLQAPRLEIHCEGASRTTHLSYHGGEHYNSIRALDDPDVEEQPPKPIPGILKHQGPQTASAPEEQAREVQIVARSVPAASHQDIVRVSHFVTDHGNVI